MTKKAENPIFASVEPNKPGYFWFEGKDAPCVMRVYRDGSGDLWASDDRGSYPVEESDVVLGPVIGPPKPKKKSLDIIQIPDMNIFDFARDCSLKLEIILYGRELTDIPLAPFSCHFSSLEIKEGSCLLSTSYGRGSTVRESIERYAGEISNKHLVHLASSNENRREFQTRLISTGQWGFHGV